MKINVSFSMNIERTPKSTTEPKSSEKQPDDERPPAVDVKHASSLQIASPAWDFDRRQPVRLGFQPNDVTA